MPYFRFENLEIWKSARQLVNIIYTTSKNFPKEELFCLTNQIRRAALSIMLNITEGSDRKSDVEFVRFLRISFTSLEEVIACLYIAQDQKYIDQETFDSIYQESNLLAKKINALINNLRASAAPKKGNASRL